MPESRDALFAVPSEPGGGSVSEPPSQRLTNDDFRKLMMTPRAGSGGAGLSGEGRSGGSQSSQAGGSGRAGEKKGSSESAEKRKKKKSYYAKLKRQEDDKMAELAAKYRDRAKERRDGVDTGGLGAEGDAAGDPSLAARREAAAAAASAAGGAGATSGYRAVAPDMKGNYDAAERRKRLIQESKFLGGDMEHTHLVKGLDFALLQKVRSEIILREQEKEEAKESDEDVQESKGKADEDPYTELQSRCRTSMAKNLVRTLFNPDQPKVNELFFPGRMAYVIELEDEEGGAAGAVEATSDIPTTTIRSKADMEASGHFVQHSTTLSTNDIVINKLTQILTYLRAGSKNRKHKKKEARQLQNAKEEGFRALAQGSQKSKDPLADMPIYDDIGEYDARDSKSSRRDRDRRDRDRDRREDRDRRDDHRRDDRRDRDRKRERDRKRDYFDNDTKDNEDHDAHKGGLTSQDRDYIRRLAEREKSKTKAARTDNKGGVGLAGAVVDEGALEPDGYSECYPGLAEMADAIDDSDDEVDYSKMDLGSKKGPVGRWDFDTAEEYGEYMSKKEALPKAAFQYGVKMAEGRKTKGKIGVKNEKAKLDREWNKISALIDKRKGGGGGEGSGGKKPRSE